MDSKKLKDVIFQKQLRHVTKKTYNFSVYVDSKLNVAVDYKINIWTVLSVMIWWYLVNIYYIIITGITSSSLTVHFTCFD